MVQLALPYATRDVGSFLAMFFMFYDELSTSIVFFLYAVDNPSSLCLGFSLSNLASEGARPCESASLSFEQFNFQFAIEGMDPVLLVFVYAAV